MQPFHDLIRFYIKYIFNTVETLIIGPYFKFDWAVGELSKHYTIFLNRNYTLNVDHPPVQFLVAL